ncbi:hypothetical protein AGMMS49938_17070 [Fibrobacterales bacterium]|nr:hypothetical protein AGMMS49938_17070 [Fibrobacterales bacterium]
MTSFEEKFPSQNWELLKELAKNAKSQLSGNQKTEIVDSISPMPFEMLRDNPRFDELKKIGEEILRKNGAAAFMVAGGQGSRLGFEGPKGAFKLKLPNGEKSIFQIHAERLLELKNKYGKNIPFAIMTSPLNHQETIEHFEANFYFGLNKETVRFFEQGTMCALKPNGEPIFENPEKLALVPDGNGGCFRALSKSKTLAWFKELGIKFVFLYGVDNVLAKPCDPAFLGAFADSGKAAASKVVKKKSPEEKMGVFALKNGLPTVIEYTELPQNRIKEFDGGNIVAHLFTIESLEKLENEPLPWHLAVKKICGVEGAFKFEQFLFDAFPKLGSMFLAGVEREKEFAPVKNASGEDSPQTAVDLLTST